MYRLLFEKKGNAVWISHLDLMRLFQRAFKRAGLQLTHTQGYNPRPSVSIALPLSVGVESCCELLDFDLNGDPVAPAELCTRLNETLVDGIRILRVYTNGRKLRDLALLRSCLTFEYDHGIPDGAESVLNELFSRASVIVPKRTKNGMQDQDLIPMIRNVSIHRISDREVVVDLLACCQNPTLNPMQMIAAVNMYAAEVVPDFARCSRKEIYDAQENVFR